MNENIYDARDWIADHTMSYDDAVDMIEMAVNSNPEDIDFSKRYVMEYQISDYKWAIKCLDEDEINNY